MTVLILVSLLQRASPKLSLLLGSAWGFSDKFVNTVNNSNPRFGLILQQRLNLKFNTVSSVVIANFYVRGWAKSYIASDPPFDTSSFLISRHRTFSEKTSISFFSWWRKEHRIFVQVRLISKLLRSTVWITSGLLTIFQIVARILAASFPVALIGLHFCKKRLCNNFLFIQLTRCNGFPRSYLTNW